MTDYLRHPLALLKTELNKLCEDKEPWKIVFVSVASTIVLVKVYDNLTHKFPLTKRVRHSLFASLRSLPFVRDRISKEAEKIRLDLEKEFMHDVLQLQPRLRLPDVGLDAEEVLSECQQHLHEKLGSLDWKNGSQSGTIYKYDEQLTKLLSDVYALSLHTNPLHPDAFPGLRKMEAEVVAMAVEMFNGDENCCGSITSGGTESIILACKAYRDFAIHENNIQHPELVVPVTAHAAFDKAAQLLDMHIIHVPVDPETQRVDIKAMRKAINPRRTCVLVGSAPQFPHGTIDDVEAIAELGHKYNIPVHVDACLGGFLLPFMKEAGFQIKPFDFSVQGVTSISADTHKYGFAPKGSSVLLFKRTELRRRQWFCVADWPGGIYATATIGGSRAGGLIAACWASLLYHGRDKYIESTRKIITTTRYITDELKTVKGIKIVGVPEVSVVAIGSDQFNIYGLSDAMKKLGWSLNALQFPSCVHICVTLLHTHQGVAEKFVLDVKDVVETILSDPSKHEGGSAAIYGMAQSIPDRSIVDTLTGVYLDSLYVTHKNIKGNDENDNKDKNDKESHKEQQG